MTTPWWWKGFLRNVPLKGGYIVISRKNWTWKGASMVCAAWICWIPGDGMGETWDGEGVEQMSRGVWRTCPIFCRYMGKERRQFFFLFTQTSFSWTCAVFLVKKGQHRPWTCRSSSGKKSYAIKCNIPVRSTVLNSRVWYSLFLQRCNIPPDKHTMRSLKRSAVCFSRGTVFLSQKRCLHGENMRIWVNVETLQANKHTFWEWPFQKVQTVTLRSSPKAENHPQLPFSKRCFLNHQNMGSLWHCFNMS